jgi:hypothetical protein
MEGFADPVHLEFFLPGRESKKAGRSVMHVNAGAQPPTRPDAQRSGTTKNPNETKEINTATGGFRSAVYSGRAIFLPISIATTARQKGQAMVRRQETAM